MEFGERGAFAPCSLVLRDFIRPRFGDYHGGRVTLQCSYYGSLGIAARVGIVLSRQRGWAHSHHFALCFLSLPVGGEKAVYRFRSPLYARKPSTNAQKSSEDERMILPLTSAAAAR